MWSIWIDTYLIHMNWYIGIYVDFWVNGGQDMKTTGGAQGSAISGSVWRGALEIIRWVHPPPILPQGLSGTTFMFLRLDWNRFQVHIQVQVQNLYVFNQENSLWRGQVSIWRHYHSIWSIKMVDVSDAHWPSVFHKKQFYNNVSMEIAGGE